MATDFNSKIYNTVPYTQLQLHVSDAENIAHHLSTSPQIDEETEAYDTK